MSKYKNPIPTVDIIIELEDYPNHIVLIERKNPPFGKAIPGGFVDEGEPLWDAATREAKEETGLDVNLVLQLHTYSNPKRDPRKHTVSTVFIAKAKGIPKAGDDANNVLIVDPQKIHDLVFDHHEIIKDYLFYKQKGILPSPYK